MPGLLADCFADRLPTHPGQHTGHPSVAAAPPKDLGQNGGRSHPPVAFAVSPLQPHTHPGQHTVHLSVAAAPPKDLGQNGGRSYHPVPFVVGHLQPHIHRTVGGRLRHSLVVEHHHAGSTGARPP